MKRLNVKLKSVVLNKGYMFFISILFLFLYSTIVGLTDYDFIWQTYLGKIIVTEHRFDGISDLVWGTQGLGVYLDHEWLSNIFFYVMCNIFGDVGGVVAVKVVLEIVCSVSIYYLVKEYIVFDNMSLFTYACCCFTTYLVSILLVKPKPYVISMVLCIWLLLLLEHYRRKQVSFKGFAIGYVCILLLWNNFHSGSIAVFFIVSVCYWLFVEHSYKLLGVGVFGALLLGVNPYGYKLIYFDIVHFFDDTMKKINKDWASISEIGNYGVLCALMIGITIVFMFSMYKKEADLFYVSLFIIFMFMMLQSARHFLYMYPIMMCLIVRGQFVILADKNYIFSVCTLIIVLVVSLLSLRFVFGLKDYDKIYTKNYITTELADILCSTNKDNDGLYDGDSNIWVLGLKSFRIGAFTYTKERAIDRQTLESATVIDKSPIINKYHLTKFLISPMVTLESGERVHSSLYNYLVKEHYTKLYEDINYAYFIQ